MISYYLIEMHIIFYIISHECKNQPGISNNDDILRFILMHFGVNHGPKEPFVSFCNGRLLSPTGRCKTFDAAADGAWESQLEWLDILVISTWQRKPWHILMQS